MFISLKDSHTHESDVWFDQAQTYGCFYGIWRKIRKGRNLNTFKSRLELFVPSAPVMKKSKNRCKSYKVATLSRASCLICEQSPTLDENNSCFFYMIHFCECVLEIYVFDREGHVVECVFNLCHMITSFCPFRTLQILITCNDSF